LNYLVPPRILPLSDPFHMKSVRISSAQSALITEEYGVVAAPDGLGIGPRDS